MCNVAHPRLTADIALFPDTPCSPFKSRENIYKGSITVVSYVDEKANSPEEETIGAHVAYDVVKCPMKDGAECTKG